MKERLNRSFWLSPKVAHVKYAHEWRPTCWHVALGFRQMVMFLVDYCQLLGDIAGVCFLRMARNQPSVQRLVENIQVSQVKMKSLDLKIVAIGLLQP